MKRYYVGLDGHLIADEIGHLVMAADALPRIRELESQNQDALVRIMKYGLALERIIAYENAEPLTVIAREALGSAKETATTFLEDVMEHDSQSETACGDLPTQAAVIRDNGDPR